MHSTASVMRFVLLMTSVVALLLAALQNGLKSRHDANEAIYSKKATLGAISNHLGLDYASISDEQVEEVFSTSIQELVVNGAGEIISVSYTHLTLPTKAEV